MKKPSKSTIIRTLVLVLALVNQILTATGHSIIPISDEEITQLVTLIFTICASVVAWWKNNSFTQEAISADELMREAKKK